jgi:sulfotransferase family protein
LRGFRRARVAAAPPGERPPAPFVVGVPRSGTTLLRLMLDAHSLMAIPPETHFLPKLIKLVEKGDGETRAEVLELVTKHRRWPDFELDPADYATRLDAAGELDAATVVRAFYEAYAGAQGKPRWGEKTPQYLRMMGRIARTLPEARFIHIIRDGRDVALSLLSVEWGPASIAEAAEQWVDEIRTARGKLHRIPHYTEVRFEELVGDPEPLLRRVCDFVELEFEPEMLAYHQGASSRMGEMRRDFEIAGGPTLTPEERVRQHALVSAPPSRDAAGRWQEAMSRADLKTFESIAGELLDELGYELGSR